MSHENFDPSKFKNIAEMPKEEQENFENVEGGFVRKEAKETLIDAELWAKRRNGFLSRSFIDIVLGKNKRTADERLQANAQAEDSRRFAPPFYSRYSSDVWDWDDYDTYEQEEPVFIDFINEFTPDASAQSLSDALAVMRGDFDEWQVSDIEKEIERRKETEMLTPEKKLNLADYGDTVVQKGGNHFLASGVALTERNGELYVANDEDDRGTRIMRKDEETISSGY